jgi:hypothetical protein
MPKERQDDLRKKALARADELKQMLDAIKAEAQSVSIADGWLGDPKVCYTRRVRARVWSGGGGAVLACVVVAAHHERTHMLVLIA